MRHQPQKAFQHVTAVTRVITEHVVRACKKYLFFFVLASPKNAVRILTALFVGDSLQVVKYVVIVGVYN